MVVLVLFPLTQGWWTGYLGLSEYLDGRVEMMLTNGRSILGLNSGSGRVVRYQVLCVEGVSYNRENTDTASRLVWFLMFIAFFFLSSSFCCLFLLDDLYMCSYLLDWTGRLIGGNCRCKDDVVITYLTDRFPRISYFTVCTYKFPWLFLNQFIYFTKFLTVWFIDLLVMSS